jgi:hypothetical protein
MVGMLPPSRDPVCGDAAAFRFATGGNLRRAL